MTALTAMDVRFAVGELTVRESLLKGNALGSSRFEMDSYGWIFHHDPVQSIETVPIRDPFN